MSVIRMTDLLYNNAEEVVQREAPDSEFILDVYHCDYEVECESDSEVSHCEPGIGLYLAVSVEGRPSTWATAHIVVTLSNAGVQEAWMELVREATSAILNRRELYEIEGDLEELAKELLAEGQSGA